MKIKRQKRVQRILNFFRHNFGHREPYQIIIDGTFTQGCLINKINIKEQLPKYFNGEVKCLTTLCAIQELEKLGPPLYGASLILKQFPVHKCGHTAEAPKPAIKCVKALVSEKPGETRYFVATQDPELREKVRKIPGISVLYLHGNSPTLEEPSDASKEFANKTAQERIDGSSRSNRLLEDLKLKEFGPRPEDRPRKKKKTGPNPLSCLKSKRKKIKGVPHPTSPPKLDKIESSGKKRKRNRNKKKKLEAALSAEGPS